MIKFINYLFGNPILILSASITSLLFKLILIISLYLYTFRRGSSKTFLLLIVLATLGSIFCDLSWILKIGKQLFYFNFSWQWIGLMSRIAWAFSIIQYQSLALLLENLAIKTFKFKKIYILYSFFTLIWFFYFIFIAFYEFNTSIVTTEIYLHFIGSIYLFVLLIPSITICLSQAYNRQLPKILTQQMQILIYFFIIPQILLEFLDFRNIFIHFNISQFALFDEYTVHTINTILITLALYYTCRKMLNLRFLNFKDHVEEKNKYTFVVDFKNTLEEFSHFTTMQELAQSTQNFFEKAFGISHQKIKLYIRKALNEEYNNLDSAYYDLDDINTQIEKFLLENNTPSNAITHYLRKHKIVIKDEIEFNNFYKIQEDHTVIISFLNSINADVFLPVYNQDSIIAYVIIEQNARTKELYSNIERDEMLVFTSYLGKIISLLRHNNFNVLFKNKKEIEEELYNKHQEISQYKESISAFLKNNKQKKYGVIFYKNNRLTVGNQETQELMGVDIFEQQGYALAQKIKKIAKTAYQYKATQNSTITNFHSSKILISAIPNIDQDMVTLILYYPEISDIVNPNISLLKDPSKWEYLLSLETTKSGQLINNLIPSNSATLLNFKINLLHTALSKKATLLDVPAQDLIPTVELLHHISLRSNLQIINLTHPEKGEEIALKIFGMNPLLLDDLHPASEPLLKALDSTGTLFIQNIDFLNIATQNMLADYLAYGFFCNLKNDLKLFTNVRIICSTTKNLSSLVAEGKFSKALFTELSKTIVSMPPLVALPKEEIYALTQDIADNNLNSQTFKSLLELTEKEKDYIINEQPLSITEFKEKIQHILAKKSVLPTYSINQQIALDPAYNIADPEVAQAVRLGKKALKDPQMMSILWHRFQNQNKIATLLGVNRSSVNRRCKEYSLY